MIKLSRGCAHARFFIIPMYYNNWIGDTNTLRIGKRNTISLIFPVVDRQPRGTVYNSSNPDLRTHICKTIYYNGSPDDKLVIWEDGWSIEPAPEALEKKVAQYMEEWEERGDPYSKNGEAVKRQVGVIPKEAILELAQ